VRDIAGISRFFGPIDSTRPFYFALQQLFGLGER
jgi:hypothetical protein